MRLSRLTANGRKILLDQDGYYQYFLVSLFLIARPVEAANMELGIFKGTLLGTEASAMAGVTRRDGIKFSRKSVGTQKLVSKKLRTGKSERLVLGPLSGESSKLLKASQITTRKPVLPIRKSIADNTIVTGATANTSSHVADNPMDKNEPNQQPGGTDKSDIKFEASIAGSIGFDTNINEDNDPKGSPFHRYDANLLTGFDEDGLKVEAKGELVLIERTKDDRFSDWKLTGAIKANRDFGKGRSGGFGFSFENDSTDPDNVAIENKAFAETEIKNSLASVELRADVSYEIDASDQSSDEDDAEAPEDLLESGITATARYRPGSMIAPFLRLGLTDIYYTRQKDDALNRNALATNALLGFRLNLDKKLQVDLAARYDQRFLDAPGLSNPNNLSAYMSFKWQPTDKFSIEGEMEQLLDNPSSSDATFAESTKFELQATWSPNEFTKLELSTEYEWTEQPEVNETTNELTLEAKIARKLNDRLSIFGALDQSWNTTKENGVVTEKYNRTQIWAGIEVKLLQ